MVVAQTSQSEMSKLREEIEYLNKKLKKPQGGGRGVMGLVKKVGAYRLF